MDTPQAKNVNRNGSVRPSTEGLLLTLCPPKKMVRFALLLLVLLSHTHTPPGGWLRGLGRAKPDTPKKKCRLKFLHFFSDASQPYFRGKERGQLSPFSKEIIKKTGRPAPHNKQPYSNALTSGRAN